MCPLFGFCTKNHWNQYVCVPRKIKRFGVINWNCLIYGLMRSHYIGAFFNPTYTSIIFRLSLPTNHKVLLHTSIFLPLTFVFEGNKNHIETGRERKQNFLWKSGKDYQAGLALKDENSIFSLARYSCMWTLLVWLWESSMSALMMIVQVDVGANAS